MRDGAPRIGRPGRYDTMVDHHVVECKLGFDSHLKNSLSIASRGARMLRAFPKNCHLLPFCGRKTATPISTVPFHFLPEGVPASPGPGLRTAIGAERSLGTTLSPSAIRHMSGESANSQKMLIAAAIAEGTAVAKWASNNQVPARTAYRGAAQPEVRSEVESIRRLVLDEAIGRPEGHPLFLVFDRLEPTLRLAEPVSAEPRQTNAQLLE